MRLNLTLAGGGKSKSGGSSSAGGLFDAVASSAKQTSTLTAAAPKPRPTPPPAPATGNIRDQAVNIGNRAAKRRGAENIRNSGGGRGTKISSAVRALKGLTGQ